MNPNAPPPPPPPQPTTTTAAEDVEEASSPTPQPKLTHSASTSSTASSQGGAGSDFEFTVSLSPASRLTQNNHFNSLFCPADELFFKGQLLPLSLPPRLHLLQSLTSPPPPPPTADWSSDATTTTNSSSISSSNSSRDSSRRSSSATEDINVDATHLTTLKKLRHFATARPKKPHPPPSPLHSSHQNAINSSSPKNSPAKTSNKMKLSFGFLTKSKRMSKSAKQVIQKYMSKVKPLVDKISNHHHNHHCHLPKHTLDSASSRSFEKGRESCSSTNSASFHCSFHHHQHSHSFSGNLRYPRKKPVANGYVAGSCPSSMRSSPSHSGVLGYASSSSTMVDTSSMEDLQSAILGAIAHCKNSIALQRKHYEKGSSSSSSSSSSAIFVG